jgi:hypothetical protein
VTDELLSHSLHCATPIGSQVFIAPINVTLRTITYLPTELRNQLHTLGAPPNGARPVGTFARDIMNRLLIDLSWASSRLEGNTYNRLDTERLIPDPAQLCPLT